MSADVLERPEVLSSALDRQRGCSEASTVNELIAELQLHEPQDPELQRPSLRVWPGSPAPTGLEADAVPPVKNDSVAPDGAHAEVGVIMEKRFTKLQEWLNSRLQNQDDLLMMIRAACENSCRPASGRVAEGKSCPSFKQAGSSSQHMVENGVGLSLDTNVSEHLAKSSSELDRLRSVAFDCDEERPRSPDPIPSTNELEMCLPGAAPEVIDSAGNIDRQMTVPPEPHDRKTVAQEQGWQSKLMDVFDELDTDNSGSICRDEIVRAFEALDLPKVDAFEAFMQIDDTGNGVIDRIEWLHLIDQAARGSLEEVGIIFEFLHRLEERKANFGKLFDKDQQNNRSWFMLRHDSFCRAVWDLLMMTLLCYVSLMLPLSFAFEQSATMKGVDLVLDLLFCCDVFLNFRTSYCDAEDTVIVDGRLIAKNYLKSWFVIDFFSSVPFDLITGGLMPSMQPARLLKLGKIARVMKLLRISRMLKVMAASDLADKLDDLSSRAQKSAFRACKLAIGALVVAHWMACFGMAIDGGKTIDFYFENGYGNMSDPTNFQKYMAAVYWAMTTLSTVGYGDIIPTSDMGRIYASLAMVFGGAFYGYIIGSVTSMVSDMDANARVFNEHMDLIQSWLDRHEEIPKLLRRRLRRHYQQALASKTAIDDGTVIAQLSPELSADTAFFIVEEHVRQNAMFESIPNSSLASLVKIIHKNHVKKGEFIVKDGDPGMAMYVVIDGFARYDKGQQWTFPDDPQRLANGLSMFAQIKAGDSFGEEIILGLEENYSYTIVATSDCEIHSVTEDNYQNQFRNMPELLKQMEANFARSRGLIQDFVRTSSSVPVAPADVRHTRLDKAKTSLLVY